MTATERKTKIAEITRGNYFSTDGKGKRIRYSGDVKTFIEYEIPMDLIIYNVENGRIASLVKSYEREHSSLNPEKEEDAKQIAQFLYDSNDTANKKTRKNIIENGQLETGIITCDGVLVDGNRRVSLMRQILEDSSLSPAERARCEKFRAIVLDEYLEYFSLDGLYTRLPKGFEDDLQKLYTAIRKIKNGSISWIPTNRLTEIECDLKCISFDYIRLNAKSPDGFDFRSIASTSSANFLANEDIWESFVKSWQEVVNNVSETTVDDVLSKATSSNESSRLLEAHDNEWRKNVKEGLLEAFNDAQTTLNNKKEKEKPGVLFKRALNALQQIDLDNLSLVSDKSDIIIYIKNIETICKTANNNIL